MSQAADLNSKYDRAAPAWSDKMRLLGYYDAYLGLLSSQNFRAAPGNRVLDVGCGTGAFAEAWIAIQGPSQHVTLLDPSREMLARAEGALLKRNVEPVCVDVPLEAYNPSASHDCLLAAHILEHVDDPVASLRQMRRLVDIGGHIWLVVSKPHWCNAIIWFQWRHRAYRPADVTAFLKQAGWVLDTEYAFPAGPPSRTSRGYLARAV